MAKKREAIEQAKHDLLVAQSTHWQGPEAQVEFAQTALLASIAASLIDIAETLRIIESRGQR